MIIKVYRENPTNKSVFGFMFVDGFFECYSLENAEKLFPIGTYDLELYDSPRNKRIVPLLKNVPNREMIEIHIANYYTELEGCIAVGSIMERNPTRLLSSTLAFSRLMAKIRANQDKQLKIQVEQI